jgi:acyl dehydratase
MTEPPGTSSPVAPTAPDVRALSVPFAELPSLAGRSFRGDWFVVDASRLPLFDEASYVTDNPFPLDESGYPDNMVEGFHLLALLDHLVNPLLRITGVPPCIGWNYGLDRVRFISPVRAGDQLRVTGTVGSVRPKDGGFLVLCQCTVDVKGRDRPGMVADWWTYWLPGEVGGE